MDTSRQNTASQILDKLTNDILQGVYLPNDKLQIKALKDRYNVGTSPLREALSQLIAKDLGVDISNRIQQLKVEEPPKRKSGIKVANVAELVSKLKNEAKVI